MVVVRLTRVGKKKQAHYRIVVADSRRAVQGKFLSILGWYNPHTKELQVKKEELKAWFDKGAQPSNTLAKLLKTHKIDLPKWVKITEKKKAPKKAEEKKEAPASNAAGATPDVANAKDGAEESTEIVEEVEGDQAPSDGEGKSEATADVAEVTEETPAETTEPEAVEEEAVESDSAEASPDKEVAEEEVKEEKVEVKEEKTD